MHVVPDGHGRDYFPPTFINDPMFTFRLANALFLEATDVVFLDELFFL